MKFHIAERRIDGSWHRVVDRAELTRLGEGLEATGEIGREAIDRTADAIAQMVTEAKAAGVLAIAAVGTAGLRIARNRDAVLAEIKERSGVGCEVVSGEEESRLAYLAVVEGIGLAKGSLVVFDTGGGSSQFTFGTDPGVEERFSVDVGAVRSPSDSAWMGRSRPMCLPRLSRRSRPTSLGSRPAGAEALVGMGGALTNMAAVSHSMSTYDPDVVQGTVLDRGEVDRQIELYRTRDIDARREIIGLQPKRADVILAGACIVRTVMEKLGQDSLTISDRGLRHGVLSERFGAAH